MKLIESILVFIIAIYIVILPFVTNVFAAHEVLTISAVILLLCVCILCVLYSGRSISVTLIDVAAFSFIIYEWINIGIIRNFQMDGLVYFEGIALGMIYLITKLTDKRYLILLLLAIALSGGIQGLVGILQYFDVLASGHTEFKITGSFNNPGPFGGYLSISFIAAICLLFLKKDKKWRVGSSVLFLLIGSMLICSNSRAAWLAVMMTLLYVFCKTGLVAVRNVLKKRMIYSFIVILCIAVVAGLYQYKKSSADVRLLIWTVSVSMFTDAFLCGHGIGSFPMKYIEYQADYFESHPDSESVVLSDNNTQAFNEFIAIACEQGVLGLIFVLLIVCMAFLTKGCDLIQYLLLSLCIFSSFSYPGDVFPLKIYFPLFIGLVSGSSAVCLSVRRTVIVPCCVTFF